MKSPRFHDMKKKEFFRSILIVALICVLGAYFLAGCDMIEIVFEEPTEEVTVQEEVIPTEKPTERPDLTPTKRPAKTATSASSESGSTNWWQVFFTDPGAINDPNHLEGSIPEKLIGYINAAQETIHIAAFEFNLTPVAEALIAAHKRGVEVQWVTDDENGIDADKEEGHGQFAMLKKAGIKIKDDGRSGLMHNKFWIFDGQIVWTGSTNVTVNCNFRNNNNVIVIESPELAAIYEREFEEMWAGKFGPTSPSTVDEQKIKIKSTEVEVYFASEDETISHLIPLVQSAQKSIRFMAFSYTHDKLMEAMLERQKAGVDVRGIFETRGSETEFSALRPMYCAKIPVRQDGNPATFHHKVIVIDNKILITGSLNFSANADETNDENTIVLFNAKVAAKYIQEFERRWAEAVEPDPAKMKCK